MQYRHIIALAVVLLAAYASAIPESELDWYDRDIIAKLINGTIVVDIPEHKKRQVTVAALIYQNENEDVVNGNFFAMAGSSSVDTGFGVSSVRLLDDAYILVLFSGAALTGDVRVFRTKKPINKLADQGNFNDKAKSAAVIYVGALGCGAHLWEGAGFSKRVSYVTCGEYTTMSSSGTTISGYTSLSIGSDTLSSFEVYPNHALQLFQDINYGGSASGYQPWLLSGTNYEVSQVNVANAGIADNSVSSFKLT